MPLYYSLVLKNQLILVLFDLQKYKSEVKAMPSTMSGRELVKKFLQDSNVKTTDLARTYGMTKQEVSDYISGRKVNPAGNKFVLKVIHDFNIS